MRRLYFHCRAFLIRKKMSSTVALTQIGDILCEMVRSFSFLFFPSVFEGGRFELMLVILHLLSSSFVSSLAQRLNKIYPLHGDVFC